MVLMRASFMIPLDLLATALGDIVELKVDRLTDVHVLK